MFFCGDGGHPPYEEMLRQQASIQEEERCEECKGLGWLDVGCTIAHRIYAPCFNCFRRGLKAGSVSEIKQRAKEEREG